MSEASHGQITETQPRAWAGKTDASLIDVMKAFTAISTRPEAIAAGPWEIRERIAAEVAETRREAERLSSPPETAAVDAAQKNESYIIHNKALIGIFLDAKEGKLPPFARA